MFREELQSLLNRYCQENGSNTPDFILADFLARCLLAFDAAVNRRAEWYGQKMGWRSPQPEPDMGWHPDFAQADRHLSPNMIDGTNET